MQTIKNERRRVKQTTPLYLQIAEQLKTRILNKEFPCGTSLPAESELAASFGVNHLTLRKGLKVLREQNLIIQQHGRGNFVTFAEEAELRICCIMGTGSKISSYYNMKVLSELTSQLSARKGNLIIVPTQKEEDVLDLIHRNRASALLTATMNDDIVALLNGEKMKYIPVGCLNVWNQKLNKQNRFYAGTKPDMVQNAVQYLKKLGHKKIAYITQNHVNVYRDWGLTERNEGFLSCGLSKEFYFAGDINDGWYTWSSDIMHKIARMLPEERPTAVICSGFTFAAGAWNGALQAGLRIPEDISLIGIDGEADFFPQMTAVKQPLEQIVAKMLAVFNEAPQSGGLIQSGFYEFDSDILEHGSCRMIKS